VAKNDKGEATSQTVEVVDIPQEEEEVRFFDQNLRIFLVAR
jgi:hypothetical protein